MLVGVAQVCHFGLSANRLWNRGVRAESEAKRMRLSCLLAVLAVSACPVTAFAGAASDAVAFFYEEPGRELEPENRARFTDPALSVLAQNEQLQDSQDVCLNFVPSLDAQDFDEEEVRNSLTLTENIEGDTATVVADFMLFEEKHDIEWTLKNENGVWKVADIASPASEWRLSAFTCETGE